ncbi:MAG: glycosyltransferase family 2 protein [Planctomycetales bacterium]|nr:glycosyltransferase family 2 protein [Planctomycetales bacterium]
MTSSNRLRICCIVPAYNRAHLINEALDSVTAQTRSVDEVVVVDDGSTDKTVEVIEKWGESAGIPFRLLRQSNRGAAAARNTAIRATDAELIAPLDSDDVWVPEHVEVLENAFIQHPELVVSAGNTDRLDSLPFFKRNAYGEELFTQVEYDELQDGLRIIRGSAFKSLLKGAYIQTASCVFRREPACSVGLFDETLRSYEDQLFFLRMSRMGPFGLYMAPVTLLRKHDDNTTHRRHIASHIVCAISALEKARDDATSLNLEPDELAALQETLDSKIGNATERASRYGMHPLWTVSKELFRRGYRQSLFNPKPFVRAMIYPRGDRGKLQQNVGKS